MMVNMRDQISDVSLDHIVNSDEIRRVLISPNGIPFGTRKDIALCLASHLMDRQCEAPEVMSDTVARVTACEEWTLMRKAVDKNDLMPKLILGTVLRTVFASADGSEISDGMRASWKRISSFIRTMDIISSIGPEAGFGYSVRDAHSELIAHTKRYENLMERNDDLEWMSHVMRSLGSEMIGHGKKDGHGKRRGILAVIDTSNSMYGEPTLIAKGLMLALAKRMLADRKEVNVLLFSSDLPVLSPSRGRDMMDMISFQTGSGEPFDIALRMLLERMKGRRLSNTDLILVSKGAGIINDPNFTRDWEAYKRNSDVRVITAVAGGSDACGLTELSDEILIFDDASVNGKAGEFARLTDILS